MNKTSVVLIAVIASCGALAKTIDLNGEWNFSKDGAPETVVRVPHDWSIGANFDETKDEGSGMLPWKGEGRYSRSFTLSKEDAETLKSGGEAYIEFDGVMAQPAVVVNGVWVGGTTYGYLSFSKRIGIHLKEGENKIEVVANTHPHWSRWYPGGGIYRDVRLRVLPKGHVVPGSVWIRTPEVAKDRAKVVATWRNDDGSEGNREFDVKNPVMWDVDNPHLYKLEIGGETYRYGIRIFKWTADDGFHLNGRRLQLQGVCLHSDLGLLGMAFSKDAARRQLKAVAYRGGKKIGEDFVRTAGDCVAVTATRDPYSDENDEFVFYRLAAVDAKGVLCPWETGEVEISVSGAGEFVAAGNGNPHDRMGFSSKRQKLFYGRAMVAVRRTAPGEIKVKAVLCK